jgi:hypothetical protein
LERFGDIIHYPFGSGYAPKVRHAVTLKIEKYLVSPLDERHRMILSGADRDAFLAAIERKPDPSVRLVDALKRRADLFG